MYFVIEFLIKSEPAHKHWYLNHRLELTSNIDKKARFLSVETCIKIILYSASYEVARTKDKKDIENYIKSFRIHKINN